MRILYTVASLNPSDGGIPQSVAAMCSHLGRLETKIDLVTRRSTGADVWEPSHKNVQTSYARQGGNPLSGVWKYWKHFASRIESRPPRLVHDHGVWLPTNIISALEAHRRNIPHVVTTHGMLEPWALNHHPWKKRLSWHLYQRKILDGAALIHATADAEADNLQNLGLDGPIAVIPNGVPVPDSWKTDPSPGDRRTALFLSRIHPKKGLLNLLDAWDKVEPTGWDLIIAGPSEGGHRAEVEERARQHGLEEVVQFIGPVDSDDKWELYRACDLFVLPTFSENFGIVVAEALASGLPVITTTGAPWGVLDETDAGWWVEPDVASIAQGLEDATSCSDETRLAMGRRGRQLVEERFSWEQVACDLKAVYRWILGEGARPSCVRVS